MEAMTQLLLILGPLAAFFLVLSLIVEIIERANPPSRTRRRRNHGCGELGQRRSRSPRRRGHTTTKSADPSLCASS